MASILFVKENGPACQQVAHVLQNISDCPVVQHVETIQEALLALPQSAANVVVVGSRLPDGDGLQLARQIQSTRPHLQIVMLLDGSEAADLWPQMLKIGLRNVLMPPFDPQMVSSTIYSAAESADRVGAMQGTVPALGRTYVISVAAARGGLGKTVIATNLAVALSERSERVALLDLSAQPNDLAVILDDVPRVTIADLIGNEGNFPSELLDAAFCLHPKLGLRYLGSPAVEIPPNAVTKPFVTSLLAGIRQTFEFTFIDTGAPDAPATRAAIEASDLTLLVTNREMLRIVSTSRLLGSLLQSGVDADSIRVIVNRGTVGSELSEKEIEQLLGTHVAAYLPAEPAAVTYSINSGKPLVAHDTKRSITLALSKIADAIYARSRQAVRLE